jgi:hypothetical protein
MGTTENGHLAEDVDAPSSRTSAASVDKGKGDRRTVRGVPDEIWDRLLKGMEITGSSQGQWISDAIASKFIEDLKRERVPATIQPQVTALTPTEPEAPAQPCNVHLAVLQTVAAFAQPPFSEDVQRAAGKVIIDRCRLLLEGRRAPRVASRQPEPAQTADENARLARAPAGP